MTAKGVLVHGLNFSITFGGKRDHAGFFTTFFVPGLSEDDIVESITQRLAERIAQDDCFLPSSHSYFQIEDIWDAAAVYQTGGFTFYTMSFAQYIFATVKAPLLGVLVTLGVGSSTHRPVPLRVGA